MSAFFSIMQLTDMAVILYAIAGIILIFLGRTLTGNYGNFTVVFITFSALYSLSGPIAARYGGGIPGCFPTPYLVDEYLLHYSLAIIGMTMGLVIVAGVEKSGIRSTIQAPTWNKRTLFQLACAFAATASFMGTINFLRVGGLETLFAGKAAYQSAIYELPGALPSSQIIFLSTALLGLALSAPNAPRERWMRLLALWLVCSTPLIITVTLLGQRGIILKILLIFTIGYLFFKPIKRFEFKWVAIILPIYLIMGFLFGIRGNLGHLIATGDLNLLMILISEPTFWATSLNPASNEFGAVFGNFNTYILSGASDLRLGETYLRSLTMPIPRFIWPDKPQAIIYEFRDTYFHYLAQRGAIAGTGYSSVLEAYINFGTFGVPIIYLLVALAMGYLERMRSRSRSLAFAIFYLTLLPVAISFHRSCFWMPIFWPLLSTFVGTFSYIVINSIFRQSVFTRESD